MTSLVVALFEVLTVVRSLLVELADDTVAVGMPILLVIVSAIELRCRVVLVVAIDVVDSVAIGTKSVLNPIDDIAAVNDIGSVVVGTETVPDSIDDIVATDEVERKEELRSIIDDDDVAEVVSDDAKIVDGRNDEVSLVDTLDVAEAVTDETEMLG